MTIGAGGLRAYEEADWRDAIVVLDRGEIELECMKGSRRRFGCGSVLWLTGLSLRAIHNPGSEPAVLVAVSRRGPGRTPPGSGYARRVVLRSERPPT